MFDNRSLFDNNELIVLGDAEVQMQSVPGHTCLLQRDVIDAYQQLRRDAAAAGFDLRIASGFRSFSRQLAIWNGKAEGARQIVDDNGVVINPQQLPDWRCVQYILRFSALPGASRHHWGTDVDIYDAAAITDAYPLQLTIAETEHAGPFAAMHRWLDERIASNRSYGFYRPYAQELGGVSPEPWHLSYAPLAQTYLPLVNSSLLYQRIKRETICYRSVLLAVLPQLVQRYVQNVVLPPWGLERE